MFKKLFTILLVLLMLCACNVEEPAEPVVPTVPEEPETRGEIIKIPEAKNEEVTEEGEPEIITETVNDIPEAERIHAPGLTEKDEPKPEDIKGIGIAEMKQLSEKQKELIISLLQKENWKERNAYEGSGKEALVSLLAENGGLILIICDDDETVIVEKWGENEEFRKYYDAPKEVFKDLFTFNEKLLKSMEIMDTYPETPEEYSECFDKYIAYMTLPLRYDFDEENYIDDVNAYHLLSSAYFKYTGNDIYDDPESDDLLYPEEFVLDYIQKYFLWNIEDIRRNVRESEFDEETGLYYFPGGYGGGYFPPVVSEVRQNGNFLEIDLERYGAKDPATEEYFYLMNFETITIRLDDDGTWKYLSKKTLYTGYD